LSRMIHSMTYTDTVYLVEYTQFTCCRFRLLYY